MQSKRRHMIEREKDRSVCEEVRVGLLRRVKGYISREVSWARRRRRRFVAKTQKMSCALI